MTRAIKVVKPDSDLVIEAHAEYIRGSNHNTQFDDVAEGNYNGLDLIFASKNIGKKSLKTGQINFIPKPNKRYAICVSEALDNVCLYFYELPTDSSDTLKGRAYYMSLAEDGLVREISDGNATYTATPIQFPSNDDMLAYQGKIAPDLKRVD